MCPHNRQHGREVRLDWWGDLTLPKFNSRQMHYLYFWLKTLKEYYNITGFTKKKGYNKPWHILQSKWKVLKQHYLSKKKHDMMWWFFGGNMRTKFMFFNEMDHKLVKTHMVALLSTNINSSGKFCNSILKLKFYSKTHQDNFKIRVFFLKKIVLRDPWALWRTGKWLWFQRVYR